MAGKLFARRAALFLALIMLMAFALPALADEQVTATTALNLRSGPGTQYPVVGSLSKGESATRVGTQGSWSIIKMGSSKLYAASAYLTVGKTQSSENIMYTTIKLNVRTGPGTGYKVLTYLDKGSAVAVLGQTGSWSIIKWNDGTAYVFTSYLTSGSGSSSGSSGSSSASLMTAITPVNVRIGPGTKYAIIGELLPGETVTRTGVSGSWAIVIYNGVTAYIHNSYLTPYSMVSPGYPNNSGLVPASGAMEATVAVNIRSGPGTNYSILGSLRRGEKATRTGIIGGWTQIAYKGGVGYVASNYLKQVSDPYFYSASGSMRATSSATVRTGPGNEYSSIGTLRTNDIVTLTGYAGSWAQIRFNGNTGYVPSNILVDARDYNVSTASGRFEVITTVTGRSGPGSGYSEVYSLRGGEIVTRTGTSGSWTRVTYYGKTMFVPSNTLKKLEAFASLPDEYYSNVTGTYAYAYSEPVDDSRYYVKKFDKGDKLNVTGIGTYWYQIKDGSRTLYVEKRYLDAPMKTTVNP